MSNGKTLLTCVSCRQQYEVENSDAPNAALYCGIECEDDAEGGPEGMTGATLIERIEHAISTDDDGPERNSERIIDRYQAATEAEQAVVDDIFTSLCGWTLKTLIAGKESR